MHLDAPTLFFVTIVVMALIALLLIWTWLQNRSESALLWWSVALLIEALGTVLVVLRGFIPDGLSIGVANSLLIAACGLIWGSARLFNERTVHPSFLLGSATWLVACYFDAFYSSLPARASLLSILVGIYALLAAWEFWRGKEPLASRPAVVACWVVHAVIFFLHMPAVMLSSGTGNTLPLSGTWFLFIAFQGIIHTILAAFLLLLMAKERQELRYKTASRIDPLTGAFNRRHFVTSAEQAMAKATREGITAALILFDLDHFKRINDSLGHQPGDEVLKLFCSTALTHLRSSDVFGRLGGEEFAVILPVANAGSAREIAKRILAAFEAAGKKFERAGLNITASAGLAIAEDGKSFDDLFTIADRALYRAKRTGRNRVEDDAWPTPVGQFKDGSMVTPHHRPILGNR